MFFSDRIKNIRANDKVLDVGPGGDPHPRANVLLEINADAEALAAQRGHTDALKTDKKVVYYNGKNFPFKDKEFDYIICSHVLEHVEDVPSFLAEVFRVAKRGYFEYPLAYYDYLYNFDVHLNFLKFYPEENKILWMKKSQTPLEAFRPIQDFFYQSLRLGYDSIIVDLKPYLFEGFEWSKPFTEARATSFAEVLHQEADIKPRLSIQTAATPSEVTAPKARQSSRRAKIKEIVRRFVS